MLGRVCRGGSRQGGAGGWEQAGLTWVGAVLQACRGGGPGEGERSGNPTQSSRLRNWRTEFLLNEFINRQAWCPTRG